MTNRASSLVLILANLIPLAGVLLYWAESVVIGLVNVFKMVFCQSDNVLKGYRSLLDDLFPQRSVQASRKFPCRFESTRRNFFDGTVAGLVLDCGCCHFRQPPVLFLHELHGWRRSGRPFDIGSALMRGSGS